MRACRNNKTLAENLKNLNQKFGNNIGDKLFNIMDGSFTLNGCLGKDGKYSMYCIVRTKSYPDALDFIKSLIKDKHEKPVFYDSNTINSADSIQEKSMVHALPDNELPTALFGKVFSCAKYPSVCNFKQYLVFGESEEALDNYLSELNANKSIINDSLYRNIASNTLASKSNLTLFFNFPSTWNFINKFIDPKIKSMFEKNLFRAETSTIAGIQVSGNGEFNYNNIFLYNDVTPYIGPELAWTIKLDSSVESSTALITNQDAYKNLFFIQDKKLNIYLISSAGKIIWKRPLGERILSSTFIIDYFNNNKYQLLFNTAENLFIIDKNGNNINGFPVKFKQTATNGLALADFDHNLNYRYYIAFKNKSFVALTKDGHKADGWKFEKTVNILKEPAQCFTYHKKDYILFSDSNNVNLLNRKGEQQLKLKQPFFKSVKNEFFIDEKPNFFRIVTTDTSGQACFIYPDGHIEKIRLADFTKNHNFSFVDFDGDGLKDYLFTDKNVVNAFNQQKKNIFSIQTDSLIDQKPVIVKSKKGITTIFIGSSLSDKVYMVEKERKIVKGFPVNGNFPMNVLSLSNNNYEFTLQTGDNEILRYYYVK